MTFGVWPGCGKRPGVRLAARPLLLHGGPRSPGVSGLCRTVSREHAARHFRIWTGFAGTRVAGDTAPWRGVLRVIRARVALRFRGGWRTREARNQPSLVRNRRREERRTVNRVRLDQQDRLAGPSRHGLCRSLPGGERSRGFDDKRDTPREFRPTFQWTFTASKVPGIYDEFHHVERPIELGRYEIYWLELRANGKWNEIIRHHVDVEPEHLLEGRVTLQGRRRAESA